MNKTFKTKWSSSRQQYIVTDEKHVFKGKASKNTVTLAIAAVLLWLLQPFLQSRPALLRLRMWKKVL